MLFFFVHLEVIDFFPSYFKLTAGICTAFGKYIQICKPRLIGWKEIDSNSDISHFLSFTEEFVLRNLNSKELPRTYTNFDLKKNTDI